jgi:ATP/maltotriose-dependent transcriptional regulator MalT
VHEALSLALEHNLTDAASEVYRRLGSVHEYASDYAGARDAYATAIDYCRTRGLDEAEHTCLGCVSYIVLRTGEWKRALEVCREIADQDDDPGARAIADSVTGIIRAHRGETRRARRLLQSSLEASRRFNVAVMELVNLYGLAVVSEYEGDAPATSRWYRLLIDRWRTTQERHDVIPWMCWGATFFAGQEAEAEVTECAEVLASIASHSGNPEAMAGLAYVLGEAALLRDRADEAIEKFQQSLSHIEKLEVPLEHSLTQYRLGTALARAGRRDDAVAQESAAYRIARKLGARPLAGRIAEALAGLGERIEEGRHPEETARRRRGGLTRRQVEIVRLIATGLTNKEIAHDLYLSPRTVDMHVSNILDRLDCRSRTEASQRARDLGIID